MSSTCLTIRCEKIVLNFRMPHYINTSDHVATNLTVWQNLNVMNMISPHLTTRCNGNAWHTIKVLLIAPHCMIPIQHIRPHCIMRSECSSRYQEQIANHMTSLYNCSMWQIVLPHWRVLAQLKLSERTSLYHSGISNGTSLWDPTVS